VRTAEGAETEEVLPLCVVTADLGAGSCLAELPGVGALNVVLLRLAGTETVLWIPDDVLFEAGRRRIACEDPGWLTEKDAALSPLSRVLLVLVPDPDPDLVLAGAALPDPLRVRDGDALPVPEPDLVLLGAAVPLPDPERVRDGAAVPEPDPLLVRDGAAVPLPDPLRVLAGAAVPDPLRVLDGAAVPEPDPLLVRAGAAVPEPVRVRLSTPELLVVVLEVDVAGFTPDLVRVPTLPVSARSRVRVAVEPVPIPDLVLTRS
jgi:hypothetical protein